MPLPTVRRSALKDSHVEPPEQVNVKAGDTGVVHTFLRPSGKIIINNQKLDAITQGEFIEKGTRVSVERIEANKVIVTPADGK